MQSFAALVLKRFLLRATCLLRRRQCMLNCTPLQVGGGGLISGIAAYVKCIRPDIKIFGVEPAVRRNGGKAQEPREMHSLSHAHALALGRAGVSA